MIEKRQLEEALLDDIPTSSKRIKSGNYDVFLSFRGPDTRNNFTAHLYDRLIAVGLNVHKDDKEMNKGDEIDENLKRAISNSRICIPIFSRTYASSKACLRELSHMVESKKEIIPIFFDVTPEDVKLKTLLYKSALEKHRQGSKIELDEVDMWENALSIAAGKAGFNIANKNQAEEITAITQELILQSVPKDQDMTSHFVEIDNELHHVETLLDLNSSGFRIIGIFGMGGIGKTTLAKLIFNRYHLRFLRCCSFLANVRENIQSMRLLVLQCQLYKDIINPSFTGLIDDSNDGINKIKKGLEDKKVLFILDDMNSASQLTDLLGHQVSFASGSRIIITTRNKRTLDDLEQYLEQDFELHAYELQEMDIDRATKLFSRNAFKRTNFPPKEFRALSKQVISYIKGIPLALEVFGSSLCGKSNREWEEMIEELKKFPDKRIQDSLMISYQGLKINQQEIFLDISCYHGELNKTLACCMWEDCGLFPEPTIQALQDYSLIKVKCTSYGEILWMHDVLKDLGRAIVQEKSKESGGIHNRLQIDEILDIPHEKKANVKTLSISNATITREDVIGLCELRFLKLSHCIVMGNFEGSFPKLRWLSLNFPPSYEQNNLYWEGWGTFKADKLKALNLNGCDRDMQKPLKKFSIDWIGNNLTSLCKLEIIDIAISELPDSIERLEQLKELRVHSCSSLERVPDLPLSLTHLYLHDVSHTMQVDWSNQFKLTNIIELEICCEEIYYAGLNELSFEWIRSATNLKKLCLCLPHYVITDLEKVLELSGLEHLYICYARFQHLQHLPSSLLHLEINYCLITNEIHLPSSLLYLEINCCQCPNGILNVSNLKDLEHLKVSDYDEWLYEYDEEVVDVLVEIKGLGESLHILELEWRSTLRNIHALGALNELESLTLFDCKSLECVPNLSKSRKLKQLKLVGCHELRNIQGLAELESLNHVKFWSCPSQELGDADLSKLENAQNMTVGIGNCNKLPTVNKYSSEGFFI